jgi:hypothetical protein
VPRATLLAGQQLKHKGAGENAGDADPGCCPVVMVVLLLLPLLQVADLGLPQLSST